MPEFDNNSLYRLADLTEMTLKINKFDIIEGTKTIKFGFGGHAFDTKFVVIGSCLCSDVGVTALLLESNRGSLGLVVGTAGKRPQEAFVLVVDMTKVKDKNKFDSHSTLAGVMGSVGGAIVRGFIQDEKEKPWHERDMSEFAIA